MEHIFLLFSYFDCQRGNFWFQKIKVLLVAVTLANISCTNNTPFYDKFTINAKCRPLFYLSAKQTCKTCGISNEKSKFTKFVIFGTPVKPPHKYPWMVALTKNRTKVCGGAIISEYFIITAAHCVRYIEPAMIHVSFLTSTNETTVGYPITKIFLHPKYNDELLAMFDIALLKLKKKITCDLYKNPICLPPEQPPLPPSTYLTLAGWGAIKRNPLPKLPNELIEGGIVITNCSTCANLFDLEKCKAGYVYCMLGVANEAACFGDSGSPMFMRIEDKYYIEGVTSGGDSDCRSGHPFAFASVSSARSWIKNISGV